MCEITTLTGSQRLPEQNAMPAPLDWGHKSALAQSGSFSPHITTTGFGGKASLAPPHTTAFAIIMWQPFSPSTVWVTRRLPWIEHSM